MLDTLQRTIQTVQEDSINLNIDQSEKRACDWDEVRGVFSRYNKQHVDKTIQTITEQLIK